MVAGPDPPEIPENPEVVAAHRDAPDVPWAPMGVSTSIDPQPRPGPSQYRPDRAALRRRRRRGQKSIRRLGRGDRRRHLNRNARADSAAPARKIAGPPARVIHPWSHRRGGPVGFRPLGPGLRGRAGPAPARPDRSEEPPDHQARRHRRGRAGHGVLVIGARRGPPARVPTVAARGQPRPETGQGTAREHDPDRVGAVRVLPALDQAAASESAEHGGQPRRGPPEGAGQLPQSGGIAARITCGDGLWAGGRPVRRRGPGGGNVGRPRNSENHPPLSDPRPH